MSDNDDWLNALEDQYSAITNSDINGGRTEYEDRYGFDHYTSSNGFADYVGFLPRRNDRESDSKPREHFKDDPWIEYHSDLSYDP